MSVGERATPTMPELLADLTQENQALRKRIERLEQIAKDNYADGYALGLKAGRVGGRINHDREERIVKMKSMDELAEAIADYAETNAAYDSWTKRQAMIEAVKLACGDAEDTRRVIGGDE